MVRPQTHPAPPTLCLTVCGDARNGYGWLLRQRTLPPHGRPGQGRLHAPPPSREPGESLQGSGPCPHTFLRTLYLSLRDTGLGGISCSFLQGTLTLSWLLQCTQWVWPFNHSLPEAIERLGTLVEHSSHCPREHRRKGWVWLC